MTHPSPTPPTAVASVNYARRRRLALAAAGIAVAGVWMLHPSIPGVSTGTTPVQAAYPAGSEIDPLTGQPVSTPTALTDDGPQAQMRQAMDQALAWSGSGKPLTKFKAKGMRTAASQDYIVLSRRIDGTCYAIGNAPGYDPTLVIADSTGARCREQTVRSLARSLQTWETTQP